MGISRSSVVGYDYVMVEEFEQDCYISHEPRGDCLWCKGVFQCLR